MIEGKTVLAIIPARGGSKGIPGKNIKILAGKPLIAWTIIEAKKSNYIDRLILSSDDETIINVAKKWNCEVPFVRPKGLAQDDTTGVDPVIHAITTLQEKYDFVCLLQPTSPLRTAKDIDCCIEKCISSNSDSCVSVTEVDKHPNWMYEIDKDGKLMPLLTGQLILRRQDLPIAYGLNGAIYISSSKRLLETKSFIDRRTVAFTMPKETSIDIDSMLDIEIAENILKKRIKNES